LPNRTKTLVNREVFLILVDIYQKIC